MRAGLVEAGGFEPPFPESKSGVLPLDDASSGDIVAECADRPGLPMQKRNRVIGAGEIAMKRSEVNEIIRDAEDMIASYRFLLPPFASWEPARWRSEAAAELRRAGCGWDITDFGQGDFRRKGLVLITLRNGRLADLATGRGMLYAEKLLVLREGQTAISHYHKSKTEDIIVRGGAPMVVELHNTLPDGSADPESPVEVRLDGIRHRVEAGGRVTVEPGASITLEAGCAHAFWSDGGDSFLGEVSTVNDDAADNFFFDEVSRFPGIDEDEAPYRLIVPDYLG